MDLWYERSKRQKKEQLRKKRGKGGWKQDPRLGKDLSSTHPRDEN